MNSGEFNLNVETKVRIGKVLNRTYLTESELDEYFKVFDK